MNTTGNQPRKPSAKFLIPRLVLCILSLMLGVALLSIAIVDLVSLDKLSHDLASRSYSHAMGTVTDTSIEEGTMVLPRTPGPVATYAPRVRYTYQVAGKAYQGYRLAYSQAVESNRWKAEAVAAKYKVGSKVDVWFDPKNPANAALAHGIDGWDIGLGIINGLWLIAACACTLGFRWLRGRVRAAGQ